MRVDPSDLHQTSDELRAIATDLIEDIRSLSAEADNVMSAIWTGTAAESHRHAWQGWSDAARRLVCALGHDAYLLDVVAAEFATQDQTFARAVA